MMIGEVKQDIIVGLSAALTAVLGQVDVPSGVVGGAATLTSTGLVIWLVWHTTTKTIPTLLERHQEERKSLVSEFAKQLSEERLSHGADMERQRTEWREILKEFAPDNGNQRKRDS